MIDATGVFLSKLRALTLWSLLTLSQLSLAQETLYAYGPGGPAPAMKEAAAAFEKNTGIRVKITAGPTAKWLGDAKNNADMLFGGSESMMTDFVDAMPEQLHNRQVTPLYLRPLAILVRPGNPRHIKGSKDLLNPGLNILVVNGAGQTGAWEDMAGRQGDIKTVIAIRKNIVRYAKNSAEAKQIWTEHKDIDAWLIWNIWQVAYPELADIVPIDREYAIYRDSGIALTGRGKDKPAAQAYIRFLQSSSGAEIFAKWGWKTQ